ncbi:membrane transporter of cations and cationic drugs [Pedobacter glucosidilyticus]|nr:EamA family transporter [Pedobacter glucosidilyticus]KHJ37214.1 membrane transporter of cations and cationic drugs [Pedobacter glucosidilyticus]
MSLIFQLLSILGFSIGNSLWKKPVEKLPITLIIASKSFITTIIFLLAIIISSQFRLLNNYGVTKSINELELIDILTGITLCSISYWGLYFFNKSLKHTQSGITITISGAGTVIGFLTAIFIYNEKLSLINVLSSILATFGLWCLEKFNPSFFKLKLTKGMLFGLLSMFFWRVGGLFPLVIDKVGVLQFSLILELTVFIISAIMYFISYKERYVKFNELKPSVYIILSIALSNFCGILGNHLTLKFTSFVNYTILGFLAPIVTFSISILFYKEKYSLVQYIGIMIIIFGGLGLNYFKNLF